MRTELEALPWVLPRPRLVGLLGRRWDHRVVTVTAGAGFGKSTLIALSVAPEDDDGRVDHLVRLDESVTSATTLMRRVRQVCGEVADGVEDPAELVRRLGSTGEHCLIFDDVHTLGDSGTGVDALQAIVDALPPNVHVVLASRRRVPIALARRRAAGHVLDLDEDDLVYSRDELATIADLTDTPIEELARTGGWPALVSLTVQQGHAGALEFLAEEIIDDLDATTCDALMAASLAGGADPDVLRQVTGFVDDPRRLASRVPLVTISEDLVLRPHALWSEAVEAQMEPGARQRVLARLVDVHRARGDHGEALQLALRLSDAAAIAEVVRELCVPGHIGFDVDDIDRWLRAAPPAFQHLPEGRLLAALSLRRADPRGERTLRALQASLAELREAGTVDCEVVALSELALVYRWRGEAEQLPVLIGRLFELEASGYQAAAPLAAFARGAIHDQMGDTAAALDAIKDLRRGDLHDSWIAFVEFLRSHELLLQGRVRESYDAAKRSVTLGPPGYLGGWCAERATSWHMGVTPDRVDRLPVADELEGASIVDQVWIGSWFGALLAMAGRLDEASRNLAVADAALHAQSQPEHFGFVAWAKATLAVAEHDEARARSELRSFFEQHPVDSPIGIRIAARAPALVDLLIGDSLTEGWRGQLTGAWQQTVLTIGDALGELRAGKPPTRWPEPPMVLCALPLPWAVEMAARGSQAGISEATALADLLIDVAGVEAVHAEIDHHLDPQLREPARRIFGADEAKPLPWVRLLGPVTVTGGEELDGTNELRRLRVRELLAFIALRGPVKREVIAAALWPDHDHDRAAANIRVNLSYLGRIRTATGERVVTETDAGLALAEGLGCDVHDFEAWIADAAAAQHAGYDSVAVGLYERALAGVEGVPMVDTRETDWFAREADRIEIAVVRAAARGAALALQAGRPHTAIALAKAAVAVDPYHEEAWADLVRAHRTVGDEASAASAAVQLRDLLDDLGVEPMPATLELLPAR